MKKYTLFQEIIIGGMLFISLVQATIAAENDTANDLAIHQEVFIKCSPEEIYEALVISAQFRSFTKFNADISIEEGGKFSLFDNQIMGRNLELVPEQKVVQAWRVASWPEGFYSIVRFSLEEISEEANSGTRLTLDHTGFPEDTVEHLAEGWHNMYWVPLKSYCE